MITYDSGAKNRYMSEANRIGLGLSILRPSHKRVAVSNVRTSKGQYVTRLPFPQLSTSTSEADAFEVFPSSLMSVGKTSNDGNVSIFNDEKVQVYKEAYVLINCRGKPIHIVKQDERGRYCILFMQKRGQWHLRNQVRNPRSFSKRPTSSTTCLQQKNQ